MSNRRTHYRIFESLESRTHLCTYHWGDPAAMQSLAASAGDPAETEATFLGRINFQPDGSSPVPDYYRVDTGAPYGLRSNGLTYGWSGDNRDGRDRGVLSDQRYDTFHHLQKNGANYSWEI